MKPLHSSARPDFVPIRAGRRILYLRDDLVADAPLILARIDELGRNSRAGAGIRQSGFALAIGNRLNLFFRRSRRGGLLRLINRDIYFGRQARPLRELAIAAEAARRGLPVAEPLGALIEPLAPAVYRGAMLTRTLNGMTLWEFIRTDDDPVVRTHVLEQARHAIERIHQGGLCHADLNLHNLFVARAGESFTVVILDLDEARLYPGPLPPHLRQRNLRRLARSARKLDPARRLLDDAALNLLIGARP
ncbi:MAG TPA: lipopolysaccharide kinase InaA family protein [Candidatus Binataceae bacterium]|nr:lipopolysaccharide kinase InaA family protein [Candidatus Binataceae bacterium]